MNKEEKQLLLVDLCARLPYGVNVQVKEWTTLDTELKIGHIQRLQNDDIELKPYLRPMSSMTEEEKRHVSKMMCLKIYDNGVVYDIPYDVYTPYYVMGDCLNYLRSIHVDYSGLIEKGLAIEAPEGMYNN